MKHLCCSRVLLLLVLCFVPLFASLTHKSAMIYLKDHVSYPSVGIHDYIVLNPQKVDTLRHGFDLYRDRIYAYIDMSKPQMIDLAIQKGFKNLFLDFKEQDLKSVKKELERISLHYKDAKLIAKTKLDALPEIYSYIQALCSDEEFDQSAKLEQRLQHYGVDLIHIKPLTLQPYKGVVKRLETLQMKVRKSPYVHIVPLYTSKNFDIYGISSKNALKREIFTLVDTKRYDLIELSAHRYGALPLEYYGYVQKLYDIARGLPSPKEMLHYKGVVVWLEDTYEDPQKLAAWLRQLQDMGIRVVFMSNFGTIADVSLLRTLGVEVSAMQGLHTKKVVHKDVRVGFEAPPVLGDISMYVHPKGPARALLRIEDENKAQSIPCAITSWGGYALQGCAMAQLGDQNLWIVDPFAFFKDALALESIPAPDATTENGSRLLFSHVDGDAIMNVAEFDPKKVCGDVIYEQILKKYKLPHSISVVGAEIMPNGLYPKLSKRLEKIARKIYSLPNVEGATHTFSHPFAWEKITKDGDLAPKYRLAPKGYRFNLHYELVGMVNYINEHLYPKGKIPPVHTVFWSGNCAPRANALRLVYKNGLLNINGGDTTITNAAPYLGNVAPMGLEREGLYQIYTGAQNEEMFTNDWRGPFWGYQKVLQTFALTNKPRRLKPVDIYYHFYSGEKRASLKALKRVFAWAMKQKDLLPIFTSHYIPKAMDYFEISIAREGDAYLVSGMRDLHTLKFVDRNVSYSESKGIIGRRLINGSTYLACDDAPLQHFRVTNKPQTKTYVLSSNGMAVEHLKGVHNERIVWQGNVDLRIVFQLSKKCEVSSSVRPLIKKKEGDRLVLLFDTKRVMTDVKCQ